MRTFWQGRHGSGEEGKKESMLIRNKQHKSEEMGSGFIFKHLQYISDSSPRQFYSNWEMRP